MAAACLVGWVVGCGSPEPPAQESIVEVDPCSDSGDIPPGTGDRWNVFKSANRGDVAALLEIQERGFAPVVSWDSESGRAVSFALPDREVGLADDELVDLVCRMSQLRTVMIDGSSGSFTDRSQVTDAAVQRVVQLEHLQCLLLGGAPVTDRSLTTLQSARRLKYLGVVCTHVSDEGIERFQETRPEVCVTRTACE